MSLSSERIARLGLAAVGLVLGVCLTVLFAFSPPQMTLLASTSAATPLQKLIAPLTGSLKDTNGNAFDLATLRGKPAVIYCSSIDLPDGGNLNDRMVELSRLYSKDIHFLALNQDLGVGKSRQPIEVRVHAKVLERPFRTLLDVDSRIASRLHASHPGDFVVLDAESKVIYSGPFSVASKAGPVQLCVQDAVRQVLHSNQPVGNTLVAMQQRH